MSAPRIPQPAPLRQASRNGAAAPAAPLTTTLHPGPRTSRRRGTHPSRTPASGARTRPEAAAHDLVIVANRLPVRRAAASGSTADRHGWLPSPGGLASALTPSVQARHGAWVGGTGVTGPVPGPFELEGIALHPVALSQADQQGYYDGMANQTLWPLYHDAVRAPQYHRSWWQSYLAVNRRFAEAVAVRAARGATVWVHDYHLHLVPSLLRARRPDLRIGFFLHIPFPSEELFAQLPWRETLAAGTLGADVIGFQIPGDAENFLRVARRFGGARGRRGGLHVDGRAVHVGAFPISIDTPTWEALGAAPRVAQRAQALRVALGRPRTVLLGVDRLDYTKGIQLRLRAFRELLEDGYVDPTAVVMVQVAVPSRDGTPHYDAERHAVERLVGEINGDHGAMGRPVVHYVHQTQPVEELAALYRAADVMVVTPFRDGMNLVAKEYVAARADEDGVLVLSEFAGAAAEMRQAVIVNPHDIVAVKQGLLRALGMPRDERRRRMRRLRSTVARADVHAWSASFLDRLGSVDAPAADGRAAVDGSATPAGVEVAS